MTYLLLGLSLGFSAGIAPGPLLALILQRSLQSGLASGLRVAMAPLLTDAPIVLLALLLVGRLPERYLDAMLALGGLFVLWLGIDAIRQARRGDQSIDLARTTTARQDFWHGAVVNFFSPHPYLFWAAVGAPTVITAWKSSHLGAIGFMGGFYLMLIGSKMGLALVFSRAHGLPPRRLHFLIELSSVLLIVAGLFMLYTAWRSFQS